MDSMQSQNIVIAPTENVSLPVKKQTALTLTVLFAFLLISILYGLRLGSASATWGDVWLVLQGDFTANITTETIYELRIPRVISAVFAGAAMALSGFLLQTLARNPLADPGVLGLTNGAILVAVFGFVFFPMMSSFMATILTFFGAILTGLLTLYIARNRTQGAFILLVGIGISTTFSAFIDLLMATLPIQIMNDIQVMVSGSFLSVTMDDMWFMITWVSVIIGIFYAYGRVLTPLSLGDKVITALGISCRHTYIIYCVLSILAMAPVVALAGAINFVGLISTFFAKNLIGYRGNELATVSMLIGAIMTTWADTLGRTLFAPTMIHAGVFIAVIGVSTFILIAQSKKQSL